MHDVTHIPFGHTFEDERKVFPRHDTPQRIRRFLTRGELGGVLADLGLQEEVIDLLTAPRDRRGQVVASTLDADLLDYLRRDSYFAGLKQDYDDRIYSYFCIEDDRSWPATSPRTGWNGTTPAPRSFTCCACAISSRNGCTFTTPR